MSMQEKFQAFLEEVADWIILGLITVEEAESQIRTYRRLYGV